MGKIDMKGQRYGRLLVIEEAPKNKNIKSRTIRWKCKCDCGKEVIIVGSNLRTGNTKSCGCLHNEILAKSSQHDLTNNLFGKLTVLERVPNHDSHSMWKCKCECGNICFILGSNLVGGKTKSCGCSKNSSFGVSKIKNILDTYNIPYRVEQKENIDGRNYYWDFIVRPNSPDFYIIEYDGEQHFKYGSENGWNNKNQLKITHIRDTIKNNYAFNNNYLLIRIPYTLNYNTIEYKDLDPCTSKYVVNKYNINDYYLNNGLQGVEEDGE